MPNESTYDGLEAFMIETARGDLAALYHKPLRKRAGRPIGCLILVGGPQYRVGAHRQYIDLARHLAAQGIGVLRFDYLGMGDSDGTLMDLDERGEDIAAAADALAKKLGKNTRIFPWGLCEGASAIFMHHDKIPNLAGAVIANPWVGDARIEAQVHWRHYYIGRLGIKSIWQRIRSGRIFTTNILQNARGFFSGVTPDSDVEYSASLADLPANLQQLIQRNKPILYLASADDRERETFDFAMKKDPAWRRMSASPLFSRKDLPNADHTFSSRSAKDMVHQFTREFIETQTKPVAISAPSKTL